MIGFIYFEKVTEKLCPQPISARFDRCSRSEPKNVPQGLFRMFRLAEHSPRDALLAERSILTERASCGLCHRAKGPAQGAFGLRWSPVPPSAQDRSPVPHRAFNQITKAKPLFP
jgi:hypothetical protein